VKNSPAHRRSEGVEDGAGLFQGVGYGQQLEGRLDAARCGRGHPVRVEPSCRRHSGRWRVVQQVASVEAHGDLVPKAALERRREGRQHGGEEHQVGELERFGRGRHPPQARFELWRAQVLGFALFHHAARGGAH
jgi:hypothetical protein